LRHILRRIDGVRIAAQDRRRHKGRRIGQIGADFVYGRRAAGARHPAQQVAAGDETDRNAEHGGRACETHAARARDQHT
jgi:hypothetical protein